MHYFKRFRRTGPFQLCAELSGYHSWPHTLPCLEAIEAGQQCSWPRVPLCLQRSWPPVLSCLLSNLPGHLGRPPRSHPLASVFCRARNAHVLANYSLSQTRAGNGTGATTGTTLAWWRASSLTFGKKHKKVCCCGLKKKSISLPWRRCTCCCCCVIAGCAAKQTHQSVILLQYHCSLESCYVPVCVNILTCNTNICM